MRIVKEKKNKPFYLNDETIEKNEKKLKRTKALLALMCGATLIMNKPDTIVGVEQGIKQCIIDNVGLFCEKTVDHPILNLMALIAILCTTPSVPVGKVRINALKAAKDELESGNNTTLTKKEKIISWAKNKITNLAMLSTISIGWLATATNVDFNFLTSNPMAPFAYNFFCAVEGILNEPIIAATFAIPTIALMKLKSKLELGNAKNRYKEKALKQQALSDKNNNIEENEKQTKEQELYV